MRELAKSMLGLSWAMSVFGAQQVGKLIAPSQEAIGLAIAEVDDVSRLVQSRLTDSMDPTRMMKTSVDVLQQTAHTIRQRVTSVPAA